MAGTKLAIAVTGHPCCPVSFKMSSGGSHDMYLRLTTVLVGDCGRVFLDGASLVVVLFTSAGLWNLRI